MNFSGVKENLSAEAIIDLTDKMKVEARDGGVNYVENLVHHVDEKYRLAIKTIAYEALAKRIKKTLSPRLLISSPIKVMRARYWTRKLKKL
jgi:hypothetical protein